MKFSVHIISSLFSALLAFAATPASGQTGTSTDSPALAASGENGTGPQTQTVSTPQTQAAVPESKTLVKVGDPDFTVKMFDGSTVDIASLKGEVVLINFWATWCPPCRAELKQVQKQIINRFAGRDFVFLPISRGETREAVEKFREMQRYTFPMGLDPERKIYSLFATATIPRNFVIAKDGTILACETGYSPEQLTELIEKIENALK